MSALHTCTVSFNHSSTQSGSSVAGSLCKQTACYCGDQEGAELKACGFCGWSLYGHNSVQLPIKNTYISVEHLSRLESLTINQLHAQRDTLPQRVALPYVRFLILFKIKALAIRRRTELCCKGTSYNITPLKKEPCFSECVCWSDSLASWVLCLLSGYPASR